jgi:hypothetical protein
LTRQVLRAAPLQTQAPLVTARQLALRCSQYINSSPLVPLQDSVALPIVSSVIA